MLVLLGLAWALSYHPRAVRWRPVAWGLGLQWLLALIVLRDDHWSLVGMAVLGLLVVAVLADPGRGARDRSSRLLVSLAAAGAAGALLTLLGPRLAGMLALVGSALLVATARLRLREGVRPAAGMLVVASGVAWLIASGTDGRTVFERLGEAVAGFLDLSGYGARFLFGNLADPAYFAADPAVGWPGFGFLFAFVMLPVIVFFAGFIAVLYHLGIMQTVIEGLSRFLRWTIGTSAVETLSTSANVFIGQTEAPLLVRPYLAMATRSELLTIMVGGFATVAGGALAGYIAMGIPATHLLAASVMSAPAALAVGKVLYPEVDRDGDGDDLALPPIERAGNLVEAATYGIGDGLRLAANVGAMLIGFIALVAVADVMLNRVDAWIDGALLGGAYVEYAARGLSPAIGEHAGLFPGSLQTLFGTLLRPLAWLLGVPWADAGTVGNLLGIKLSLNEFVAYGTLAGQLRDGVIGERAVVVATYALCGFANVASIGIQIGGLGALVPERRRDLAALAPRAMIGGALASWMTAAVAATLL